MKPFQLWVFDLDGTLIDSSKDIAISVNKVRVFLGLEEKKLQEIEKNIGRGAKHLLLHCIPEQKLDLKRLVIKFREI